MFKILLTDNSPFIFFHIYKKKRKCLNEQIINYNTIFNKYITHIKAVFIAAYHPCQNQIHHFRKIHLAFNFKNISNIVVVKAHFKSHVYKLLKNFSKFSQSHYFIINFIMRNFTQLKRNGWRRQRHV